MKKSEGIYSSSGRDVDDLMASLTGISAQALLARSKLSADSAALPHLIKVSMISERLTKLLGRFSPENGRDQLRGEGSRGLGAADLPSAITLDELGQLLKVLLTQALLAHVKLPARDPVQVQIAKISKAAETALQRLGQFAEEHTAHR